MSHSGPKKRRALAHLSTRDSVRKKVLGEYSPGFQARNHGAWRPSRSGPVAIAIDPIAELIAIGTTAQLHVAPLRGTRTWYWSSTEALDQSIALISRTQVPQTSPLDSDFCTAATSRNASRRYRRVSSESSFGSTWSLGSSPRASC